MFSLWDLGLNSWILGFETKFLNFPLPTLGLLEPPSFSHQIPKSLPQEILGMQISQNPFSSFFFFPPLKIPVFPFTKTLFQFFFPTKNSHFFPFQNPFSRIYFLLKFHFFSFSRIFFSTKNSHFCLSKISFPGLFFLLKIPIFSF